MITEVVTNTIWKTKVIWQATNISLSNNVEIIQQVNNTEMVDQIVGGVVSVTLVVCFFWFLSKVFGHGKD
jgi:mannose/fructose/N-acetylgalactosamine-specific phosphotransferase system component IID